MNSLEDSFLVRWSLWSSDTQLGHVFSLPLPLMRRHGDDKHRCQLLCHRTWCWWYSHPLKLRSVDIFLVCFCFEQLPIFYTQQKGWLCFHLWWLMLSPGTKWYRQSGLVFTFHKSYNIYFTNTFTFARMYFSLTVKESSGHGFETEARGNVDSFSLPKKKAQHYTSLTATRMILWNRTLLASTVFDNWFSLRT